MIAGPLTGSTRLLQMLHLHDVFVAADVPDVTATNGTDSVTL